MFGYIAINKAEMKFRDFDIYHAYYCGLCKDLKERYGRSGQITLSYDMTFLIILLSGLYEPPAEDSIRNCVAHPFQKHAARTNEITQYAADMNIVLSYYKCLDDWTDEHKKKAWINSRLLRSKVKQIAEIFVWKQDIWKGSLHRMGFFLGKFIYLMDAYEDIDDDIANACYNPFMQFREREDFDDYCKQILTMMIAECSREFEKLPILTHAEILRNILYSGVWCRFEAICERRQSVNNQENKS